MAAHAKFSASASERWLACPGSIVLSAGAPRRTSEYAAEGTLAHRLYEAALLVGGCADWLGEQHEVDGYTFTVDAEMVESVERAVKWTHDVAADPLDLLTETQVNYSGWLNVAADLAWGTSDCTALVETPVGLELQVHDLKYGRGVPVDAKDNSQLMLYAGGALAALPAEQEAEIETVRLVIHQPRVASAPSEWAIPVADLRAWLTGRARSGAASVLNAESLVGSPDWEDTFLRSGDHCKWCPAKATCPKLRGDVLTDVWGGAPASLDEFDAWGAVVPDVKAKPEAWVAALVPKLDIVEDWAKSVRAYALELAEAGALPGYKVVAGKRGARAWTDPAAAEDLLRKVFRLKVEDAYDMKLISPTSAEKLVKAGAIGERQWKKAQALITQPEGKPHLAPASDPRPALRAAVNDFDAAPAVDDIC